MLMLTVLNFLLLDSVLYNLKETNWKGMDSEPGGPPLAKRRNKYLKKEKICLKNLMLTDFIWVHHYVSDGTKGISFSEMT